MVFTSLFKILILNNQLRFLEELKAFEVPGKNFCFWIFGEMEKGNEWAITELTLMNNFLRTQIVCNAKDFQDFPSLQSKISVGDICEFHGRFGETPSGQVSLFASFGQILSPCLRQIPAELTNDVCFQENIDV